MSYWADKLPDAQRFQLVLDSAAVLDKESGLVWERSPKSPEMLWNEAIIYSYKKELGGRMGWRLPTVEEFLSLVDTQNSAGLPVGHPFTNILGPYWSATTVANAASMGYAITSFAPPVHLDSDSKLGTKKHVWCVRGGQGLVYYAFCQ